MDNPIDPSLEPLSSLESDRAEANLSALPAEAQAELLQAVLAEEVYPWTGPDAFAEEAAVEAAQSLKLSDEEVVQGWKQLSVYLGGIWATHDLPTPQQSALQQKFADRLPSVVIAHIAEKAQKVTRFAQGRGVSMTDQMIACVRDILTHVAVDDLQVIARPMALAMRGSSRDEFVEATIQSVPQAEWASLSPIEQARLSLAAARYAIAQVDLAAEKNAL